MNFFAQGHAEMIGSLVLFCDQCWIKSGCAPN